MPKYKITSGDFELSVFEGTPRKAADAAIRRHDICRLASCLGLITMVEKLDRNDHPTGNAFFFATEQLIEANTNGFGDGDDQYSKKDRVNDDCR